MKRKMGIDDGCKRQKMRAAKSGGVKKGCISVASECSGARNKKNTKKNNKDNKDIVRIGRKLLDCGLQKDGWDHAEAAKLVRMICRCCKWKQKKLTAFVCKRYSDLVGPEFMEALMDGSKTDQDIDEVTQRSNRCCLARLSPAHIVRMVRARRGGRARLISDVSAMVEGGFLAIDSRHSDDSTNTEVTAGLAAVLGLLNANWNQNDVQMLTLALCDCTEDLLSLLQILQAVARCEGHTLQSSQVLQLVARVRGSGTYKDLSKEYEQQQRLQGKKRQRLASFAETDIKCEVCGSGEDESNILLCGDGKGKGCDKGFHLYCVSPPLEHVPADDWFCGCENEDERQKCRKTKGRLSKTGDGSDSDSDSDEVMPARGSSRSRSRRSSRSSSSASVVRSASDCLLLSMLPEATPLIEMSEQTHMQAGTEAVAGPESDEDEEGNLAGFVVGDDVIKDDDSSEDEDAVKVEESERKLAAQARARAKAKAEVEANAEAKAEEKEKVAVDAAGKSLGVLREAIERGLLQASANAVLARSREQEAEKGKASSKKKKKQKRKGQKKQENSDQRNMIHLLQLLRQAEKAHATVADLRQKRLKQQASRWGKKQKLKPDKESADDESADEESEVESSGNEDESVDVDEKGGWGPGVEGEGEDDVDEDSDFIESEMLSDDSEEEEEDSSSDDDGSSSSESEYR